MLVPDNKNVLVRHLILLLNGAHIEMGEEKNSCIHTYVNDLSLWSCSKYPTWCIRMHSMQKERWGWLIWLGDLCPTACYQCCAALLIASLSLMTFLVPNWVLRKKEQWSFLEKTNSEEKPGHTISSRILSDSNWIWKIKLEEHRVKFIILMPSDLCYFKIISLSLLLSH